MSDDDDDVVDDGHRPRCHFCYRNDETSSVISHRTGIEFTNTYRMPSEIKSALKTSEEGVSVRTLFPISVLNTVFRQKLFLN